MAGLNTNPGPISTEVLYDQGNHRSTLIWDSGRGNPNLVRTYNHNWRGASDPRITNHIITAGFWGIYCIGYTTVDRGLISALLDRWRHETHTFHFCSGDLGLSLQDVEIMLGLKVDGRPVIRSEIGETKEVRMQRVEYLLGRRPGPDDVDKSALHVTLDWLKDNFSQLPADANEYTVMCFTRAAILLFLSSQFFSDKHGHFVALWPLPFLEDLEECAEYIWGSALLAWLEADMCDLVVRKNTGVSGALTFLQWWAYSRIRAISPIAGLPADFSYGDLYPRPSLGARWARLACDSPYVVDHNVFHIRDQFDQLSPEHIVWEPYGDIDQYPAYCTQGRDMWHANVPLICMWKVEWHAANRFKRQFGFGQGIPTKAWNDPQVHGKDRRAGGKSKDWPVTFARYVTVWEGRHQRLVNPTILPHMTVSPDYYAWYRMNTRLRINPPAREVPDHGFRPVGGTLDCLKQMVRHDYQSFKRAGMRADMNYLLQGFRYLGINPNGSDEDEPDVGEDEDEPDVGGRDDYGGGGGRDDYGGGGGRDDYGGGGGPDDYGRRGRRSQGPRTHGPRRVRTRGGGSSQGQAARTDMNADDNDEEVDTMDMDTPVYHRHSVGTYDYQPQHEHLAGSSSQRWDQSLPITSHRRGTRPESDLRPPRRQGLDEVDEEPTTSKSSSLWTSMGKKLPLSNFLRSRKK